MNTRRTRIQIGPNGLIYLVATALILGTAIYTQANLLFWGLGLMLGVLVVSVAITWKTLRGVEIQRVLPTHGVVGEPLMLRYQIKNCSRLAIFSLVIAEHWGRGKKGWRRTGPIAASPQRLRGQPFGWVLHLGPQQSIQAETSCWPLQRGGLDFKRIDITSTFPFGIIRKVVEFHQPAQLLIYPQLHRMNRRVTGSLSQIDTSGQRRVERAGGLEEFFGLRDYRVGDSLKMFDWKRTAHTGNLVVRELTHPSPPRIMVLLDLTDHAPPQDADPLAQRNCREQAISLAASVICEAYFGGYQVGLAVLGLGGAPFPVHHSLPHRTRRLWCNTCRRITTTL
jgi:uncharacterized protein (DUF58 family)